MNAYDVEITYTPGSRLPWWRERLVVLCWWIGEAFILAGNRLYRLEK